MTYEITLFDGGMNAGEIELEASSLEEAAEKGDAWAHGGIWDHPGTVEMRLTPEGGDSEYRTISVG
jgi:hypothetical protein